MLLQKQGNIEFSSFDFITKFDIKLNAYKF